MPATLKTGAKSELMEGCVLTNPKKKSRYKPCQIKKVCKCGSRKNLLEISRLKSGVLTGYECKLCFIKRISITHELLTEGVV